MGMGRGLSDEQRDIIREAGDRLAERLPGYRKQAIALLAELERDPDGETWFDTWCRLDKYETALLLCEVRDERGEGLSRTRQTAHCRSVRRLEQRGLIERVGYYDYPVIRLTDDGWAMWERLTGRRRPARDIPYFEGHSELLRRGYEEQRRRREEAERQREERWAERRAELERKRAEEKAWREQQEAQTKRALAELARIQAQRPAQPPAAPEPPARPAEIVAVDWEPAREDRP
jgi:hypothetical protein